MCDVLIAPFVVDVLWGKDKWTKLGRGQHPVFNTAWRGQRGEGRRGLNGKSPPFPSPSFCNLSYGNKKQKKTWWCHYLFQGNNILRGKIVRGDYHFVRFRVRDRQRHRRNLWKIKKTKKKNEESCPRVCLQKKPLPKRSSLIPPQKNFLRGWCLQHR